MNSDSQAHYSPHQQRDESHQQHFYPGQPQSYPMVVAAQGPYSIPPYSQPPVMPYSMSYPQPSTVVHIETDLTQPLLNHSGAG